MSGGIQDEIIMIKFRTKFGLILATFASFLIINTAFADATKPFEQFYDPFPGSASDLGWLHVSWDDSQIGGIQNSYLVGVKQDLNKTGISITDFSFCTSALEERCRNTDTKLFNAALQECKSNTDFNCIESFSARLGQGSWIEGKFDRTSTFGSVRFFTGDESQGIPNGGGYSIWHFDGISHDGGNGFFLRTEIQNESYGKSTPRLFAQITPISSTVGNLDRKSTRLNSSHT